MKSFASPVWPSRVRQLLDLFDQDWERAAVGPTAQSMPGVGTCYVFSAKAVPRSLIPVVARFKDAECLRYLAHFEPHSLGREVWIGTLSGVGVDVRVQHPACVCTKFAGGGLLTLTVSSEAAAMKRFLADRAEAACERWVQQAFEPLNSVGTGLRLTSIARGLVRSLLHRRSGGAVRALYQFWWAITCAIVREVLRRVRRPQHREESL